MIKETRELLFFLFVDAQRNIGLYGNYDGGVTPKSIAGILSY